MIKAGLISKDACISWFANIRINSNGELPLFYRAFLLPALWLMEDDDLVLADWRISWAVIYLSFGFGSSWSCSPSGFARPECTTQASVFRLCGVINLIDWESNSQWRKNLSERGEYCELCGTFLTPPDWGMVDEKPGTLAITLVVVKFSDTYAFPDEAGVRWWNFQIDLNVPSRWSSQSQNALMSSNLKCIEQGLIQIEDLWCMWRHYCASQKSVMHIDVAPV